MRKTIMTILAASLIAGSTVRIASAAENHAHKWNAARSAASQQFRDANDFLTSPSDEQQYWSNTDREEGHVISAPAGR